MNWHNDIANIMYVHTHTHTNTADTNEKAASIFLVKPMCFHTHLMHVKVSAKSIFGNSFFYQGHNTDVGNKLKIGLEGPINIATFLCVHTHTQKTKK